MKVDVEKILLLAFFVLMLWIGIGTFFQHNLNHDFPYGYSASDAYQHQVRAAWVAQQGNYITEAPQIVTGYEDVLGYYMPGTFHLTGIFTHASGLESYDALFILVYLVGILAAMLVYFALRSHNKHVAMLSLPVMTLIYAKTFYSGILLGQWPFIFGTLFLAGSFWALTKLDMPRVTLVLALFLSAVALTHTSELIFVIGFFGVALLLAFRKKDFKGVRNIIVAGVLAGVVSAYYIIIFLYTWGKQFGYQFYVERINNGFPNVRVFEDFQLWIVVVMLAAMIGIYYRNAIISFVLAIFFVAIIKLFDIPAKITSDAAVVGIYAAFVVIFIYVVWKKQPEFTKVLAPYMLIIGYSSFVGFGARAFQTRFMWPVTLAPLFGYGIYRLIIFASKFAKIEWKFIYTAGVAVVLTIAILAMNFTPFTVQGTMYNERWQMFTWLQDNSETGSDVMFLYGDGYEQTSMLYNAGRASFIINTEDYIDGLNQGIIKRDNKFSTALDSGPGLPYRKGFLSFGYHLQEPDFNKRENDICNFNYYVFDKVTSRQQLVPLIQYNNFVKQTFLQSGMEEVFSNGATSILRNPNPGGDCIGQESN